MRVLICAAAVLFGVLAPTGQGAAAALLDETCYWRQYYRFAASRVSPSALRAEGLALFGPSGLQKVQQGAEFWMGRLGLDPARTDWRECVLLANRGAREFIPTPAPVPPEDWTRPDYDDGLWVRQAHLFQGGQAALVMNEGLGQYDESVDLRLAAAFYRGRFVLDDPQRAGRLSVRAVYSGGVRVFVNGRELARGHLPPGPLAPDAAAEDYPARAYGPSGTNLVRRTFGPAFVPGECLVRGTNVLAIEVRASNVHPVVLKNPIQPNWGGPRKPFPHARLYEVTLAGGGSAAPSAAVRPPGAQVWVEDVHRRVRNTDYLPPGEAPGTVRFVGTRGGAFCAQVVVGTSAVLTGLRITPGDLALEGGAARLPAAALAVRHLAPYPADDFTMARLGDERGLNATFPDAAALARAETIVPGRAYLFDRLVAEPPPMIPANTARPLWLTLTVPPDAVPGTYRGTLEVAAQGLPAVRLPVVAEVAGWVLPAPKDFRTLVGCEENPYAVARQYNVPLWSEAHFRLLEASFRELGRVGNQWLNVPVLINTEMGNRDDSPIRWIRRPDGSVAFDYTVLDRYLEVALKACGRLRVIQFIVMHGAKSAANPPLPPAVPVSGPGGGRTQPVAVETTGRSAQEAARLWRAFAADLHAHMKARGLEQQMFWGAPWEGEADPGLKTLLAAAVPGVGWTAGPHEMMANGTYAKNEQFYKLVADIRYHGGWPSFRNDRGWKSKTIHLVNPRVGGTCLGIHTTSHPLAFRVLPDRALAMGRGGFTRVGADDWAAVHYSGMAIPKWLTGMPVLFLLWPGKAGAEPSARFEMLREGVQEAEARIFIEQAIDRGQVPPDLTRRATTVLADHFRGTDFFIGNSLMYCLEQNTYGWQERSRRLFAAAAEVSAALK